MRFLLTTLGHTLLRAAPWLVVTLMLLMLPAVLLSLCSSDSGLLERSQSVHKNASAKEMMDELCKSAGDTIYRTAGDVEGVVLLNARQSAAPAVQGQFDQVDPYGRDIQLDAYIRGFLVEPPHHPGYAAVEVVMKDGVFRYRGSDSAKPPSNGRDLASVLDPGPLSVRESIPQQTFRYAVESEDISTKAQRERWIAASALRVIDLSTGQTMAERISYMVDWDQGAGRDRRAPWLRAADNACPAFVQTAFGAPSGEAAGGRTPSFVFKVLSPRPASVVRDWSSAR